jgi:enoyl-CoA hydratase/carnithine racemase
VIRTDIVDDVHLITMDAGENRFDLAFAAELEAAIGAAAGVAGALVLTGTGKYFSNGLDLDALATAGPEGARTTMDRIHAVLAAMLRFPGATVAAINGHAFGAGAMLAATADHRVMRSDRGYFCFPEVDLGLPMSAEFDALLQDAFDPRALRRLLLSGARLSGVEAVELGFADRSAPADEIVAVARSIAQGLAGKDGRTVAVLREPLVRRGLAALEGTGPIADRSG